MKMRSNYVLSFVALAPTCLAFLPAVSRTSRGCVPMEMARVGIFFGTSTGSTEEVAGMIKEALGDDAEGPYDVETLEGSVKDHFEKFDSMIVGTPTWNTGADVERSGTGWDEIYYSSMQELNMKDKNVAVFGLGDQESYAENYADATGELHDVFENLGCKMFGYTSQDGYEHEASKAIRGDKFCGLLCDMVNQEELSAPRVEAWVAQLRSEGFLEAASGVVNGSSAPTVVNAPEVESFATLAENSQLLDKAIESHANTGFAPHHNSKTKTTMWVSADGRSAYFTADADQTGSSVSP